MTLRIFGALFLAPLLVVGCGRSGPGDAGRFDDFNGKPGPQGFTAAAVCKQENDGKVYWLDGFMHLGSNMRLSDGKTTLAFYPQNDEHGDGRGNYVSVKVKLGRWYRKGDVADLWQAVRKVRSAGYRTRSGEVDESALRVHLADGSDAGAGDKIRLSVAVEPVPSIHKEMPLACEYVFVSANKI